MHLELLSPILEDVSKQFSAIKNMVDVEALKLQLASLENQVSEGIQKSEEQSVLTLLYKQISSLTKEIAFWESLNNRFENSHDTYQLLKEEAEESLFLELEKELKELKNILEKKEIQLLLSGKFDKANCYLHINSGAGGTEANDWVEMLSRMFMRWFEKNNFQVQVTDELAGEEAGIKNITFYIQGEYAYGYLKGERGVHRLVRISPFDTNKKRHTSFASVSVFPEIANDIEVVINPSDLRIDTYRASGAGGQHINKTDSAVRIVHKPTGIIVACQQERSQHKNKDKAMSILRSKLYQFYENDKKQEMKEIEGDKKDISWGSQIRSYVFHPYQMVKDARTGLEVGSVDKVMNGGLDDFIFHYLKWEYQKK